MLKIWDSYQSNSPHPNSVPLRRMLDKRKLKTPELLIEQIKGLVIG